MLRNKGILWVLYIYGRVTNFFPENGEWKMTEEGLRL